MPLRSVVMSSALVVSAAGAGVVGVGTATAGAQPSHGARPVSWSGKLFGGHHSWRGWSPRPPSGHTTASIQVVAAGLNEPKKLTVAPDGSLVVALSGDGAAPATCTDGGEPTCLDNSGAVDRVTPWGSVTTVVGGLPSVSTGPGAQATGPAEARYVNGSLQVLFQNTDINPTTGAETFGPAGGLLGDLASFGGSPSVEASFGPFEAANNPDHGAGTAVSAGFESSIDSDPYAFVPYRGGYAVADAAADDLLFVSPSGKISVLAVFPTISEVAAPGTLGPTQTTPVPFQAQAVPDSVAVGPDGALYVGELGGAPFNTGTESVYRVVPGQTPTVYAGGFTAIGDLTFQPTGRLLVLEIDQAGLDDPALSAGLPTPGAIISVGWNGAKTTVASTGLEFPTGIAVAPNGSVYVANYGVLPASGGPGGLSGEIVRVSFGPTWR